MPCANFYIHVKSVMLLFIRVRWILLTNDKLCEMISSEYDEELKFVWIDYMLNGFKEIPSRNRDNSIKNSIFSKVPKQNIYIHFNPRLPITNNIIFAFSGALTNMV